jgi:hypothetical protein
VLGKRVPSQNPRRSFKRRASLRRGAASLGGRQANAVLAGVQSSPSGSSSKEMNMKVEAPEIMRILATYKPRVFRLLARDTRDAV